VKPQFFATAAEFRAWLRRHHRKEQELLVGFYKRDSGRPSMTWPESVDQALAYGWIDGVRKRIDDLSYTIRFTPRRATSIWSAVNIKRVAELEALGLMTRAGREAFAKRSEAKSRIYSYEQTAPAAFSTAQLKLLRANAKAWAFFQAQPPGYRRWMTHRVTSPKRESTKISRLNALIALWEQGKRE
jgi:uncharacterized protein YdeI (YjbR/CyaY-like superfamily)